MYCIKSKQPSKEERQLRKAKGSNWSNRKEAFCRAKLETINLYQGSRTLTSNEMMIMLVYLLKSCENSLVRVMDKRKKTYYGKEHDFNKAEEMMEALLKKEDFLQDWLGHCELLISNNLKIQYRPTLGRIDHDRGYTLDNLEVQMYSKNTSSSTRERFSKGCITVVAQKKTMELILFESESGKNAIDKINKVTNIEITRGLLRGNLSSGLRRSNKEYSILIIGKESLMGAPEILELSFPVTAIHDEKHNSLIAPLNESDTKMSVYIDEKDAVRIDWIDEQQTNNYVNIIEREGQNTWQ